MLPAKVSQSQAGLEDVWHERAQYQFKRARVISKILNNHGKSLTSQNENFNQRDT